MIYVHTTLSRRGVMTLQNYNKNGIYQLFMGKKLRLLVLNYGLRQRYIVKTHQKNGLFAQNGTNRQKDMSPLLLRDVHSFKTSLLCL